MDNIKNAAEQLAEAEALASQVLGELKETHRIYKAECDQLATWQSLVSEAKAIAVTAAQKHKQFVEIDANVALAFEEAEQAALAAHDEYDQLAIRIQARIDALGLTEKQVAWVESVQGQEQLPERIKAASKGLGKRYGMYYPVAGKILAGEKATSPLGRRAANHKSTEKEQGALAKLCAVEEAIAANGLPNKLEVRDQLISALEVQITEHRAKVRKVAPQNAGRSTMSIKDQQVEIEYSAGKCYAS